MENISKHGCAETLKKVKIIIRVPEVVIIRMRELHLPIETTTVNSLEFMLAMLEATTTTPSKIHWMKEIDQR